MSLAPKSWMFKFKGHLEMGLPPKSWMFKFSA